MDEHFAIALRDLEGSGEGARMIVEVNTDTDPPREDEDDGILFEKFVERVRAILPLKTKSADVYISFWGAQWCGEISKSFFDLVSEQGWRVTLDIND